MLLRRDRLCPVFSMVLLKGVMWPKVATAAAAFLKPGGENPENHRKSNPDTRPGMDSLAFRDVPVRMLLHGMCEMFLPMFSSRTFMVLRLIFKSFIHLELIFVYGVSW